MKKSHLLGAVFACAFLLSSLPAYAVAVSGQGTWETTLQARDLDGNAATAEAYYDTVLDITWLADANYAGVGMYWSTAISWANSLDPYGSGITGWRLPTVTDTGTLGCNFGYSGTDCGYNVNTATGELASMFYDTLGNSGFYDTSGNGPYYGGFTNTGPFSNLSGSYYRTGTSYAPNSAHAWMFNFSTGDQRYYTKNEDLRAWAVHSGDVGAIVTTVPIAPALWLFSSGLIGLIGIARRNKTAWFQTVL